MVVGCVVVAIVVVVVVIAKVLDSGPLVAGVAGGALVFLVVLVMSINAGLRLRRELDADGISHSNNFGESKTPKNHEPEDLG